MSSNEQREPEAAKTQTDPAPKVEQEKRRKEKPGADTLTDDNPLICRGID